MRVAIAVTIGFTIRDSAMSVTMGVAVAATAVAIRVPAQDY